jgi:dihydrofolate reductase
MTAVLWHVAMSLDGFVAAPDDDMRWVFEFGERSDTADEVMRSTGAILMGRGTYEVEDRMRPGIYGGAWKGALFVLTHDPPVTAPDWMTGEFVNAGIEDVVTRARAAAGDLNVGILGATVARQCLDAGLLDEIVVHVVPIMLGDGTRLLDRPGTQQTRLEKVSVAESGQMTDLRYRVMR